MSYGDLSALEKYTIFAKEVAKKLIFEETDDAKIKTMKIFLCSFNVLCVTQSRQHIPVEFGMAEYTIKGGLSEAFHQFIHMGGVPKGYMRSAMEHHNTSHKIPIEGMPDAIRTKEQFAAFLKNLKEKIKAAAFKVGNMDVELYALYAMPDQIAHVRGSLLYMSQEINDDEMIKFVTKSIIVMNAVDLLFYLTKRQLLKMGQSVRPYAICESDLTMCTFDYSISTFCDFHGETENIHCAIGQAKRTCYLMSDLLCTLYDIEPTEAHLPSATKSAQTIDESLGALQLDDNWA